MIPRSLFTNDFGFQNLKIKFIVNIQYDKLIQMYSILVIPSPTARVHVCVWLRNTRPTPTQIIPPNETIWMILTYGNQVSLEQVSAQ